MAVATATRNQHQGHDVEQQYLPDKLVGRRYYVPSGEGHERLIGERMAERRARRGHAPRVPDAGAEGTG